MAQRKQPFPAWLILLFIATLALGTDEFVISGILPAVATDLGVTTGRAGLLVAAFALAFCLGAPVAAVLTDGVNKRAVLVAGLLMFAVGNALLAVTNSFAVAILLRVLAGLAAAAVAPTAMAIAGSAAPEGRQGRYLAVSTAGLTVALFTGVPVGTLIAQLWSWRGTFVLIAVVATLAAALSIWVSPRVPGSGPTSLTVRLAPLRTWPVLSLVAAMFLCGAGGLMFYSYLGAIVQEKLGASDAGVTGTLLLVGLVGVVAVFGGGALADAKGARSARLIIVGGHALSLLALGAYLGTGGGFGLALLALISIWSIFAWALSPAMQASIMSVDPQHAMLSMALGISGLYGGSAIGAAVGGPLIDNYGAAAVPLTAAAFVAGAWLFAARPENTASAAEAGPGVTSASSAAQ